MSKRKRRRDATSPVVSVYTDPQKPGALSGVAQYAQAQGGIGLHIASSFQQRFETLPVLVFHKDEQWQPDLVEMQPLKRWNGGNCYILMVIDVSSKYVWTAPVNNKTCTAVTRAFETILRQG